MKFNFFSDKMSGSIFRFFPWQRHMRFKVNFRNIHNANYSQAIPTFKLPSVTGVTLDKVAIIDNLGSHTYRDIALKSSRVSEAIKTENKGHQGQNVTFITDNNHHYTLAQFGIWKSGNACVPLCKSHPPDSIKYYITDSQAEILISTRQHVDTVTSSQP